MTTLLGLGVLSRIAHAADNLEAVMTDVIDADVVEIKGDDMGSPLVVGALNELRDALEPYRAAKK